MSIFNNPNITSMITEKEIKERIAVLGEEIAAHYRALGDHVPKDVVLIGILKGSFVFMADLARAIDLPLAMDFIGLSSYGDATASSGVVRLTQDLSKPIEGKHVLVVEDIVDTGLTMRYLLDNLETRGPASVKLCSLLEKPEKNKSGIEVDFLGFSIPDQFVIGYGMDIAGRYRDLPDVVLYDPTRDPDAD